MRKPVSKISGAKAANKSQTAAAAEKNKHQDDKDKEWYKTSTGIRIKRTTRDRLKKIGKFGEDYDDVINRVLDDYEI